MQWEQVWRRDVPSYWTESYLDISGSSDSSLFVDELRKNITSDMLKCRWIYDKINADILENGR